MHRECVFQRKKKQLVSFVALFPSLSRELPSELEGTFDKEEVDVKVEDKKHEVCVSTKPAFQPFSGQGHRLGRWVGWWPGPPGSRGLTATQPGAVFPGRPRTWGSSLSPWEIMFLALTFVRTPVSHVYLRVNAHTPAQLLKYLGGLSDVIRSVGPGSLRALGPTGGMNHFFPRTPTACALPLKPGSPR